MELKRQLTAAEERLTRLRTTRETADEVLVESGPDANADDGEADKASALAEARVSVPGAGSVIGVLTVPPWRPGLVASTLATAHQETLVLTDGVKGPPRSTPTATARTSSVPSPTSRPPWTRTARRCSIVSVWR
ncbi:hypothetical protein AB0E10_40660 [Streptomyces sp. NPDC048045]|uniref:hypothetical protein n=1 Tax=Streptomyces sp. NPDC048045 TaxID=3154710 RepID=UPI00343A3D21